VHRGRPADSHRFSIYLKDTYVTRLNLQIYFEYSSACTTLESSCSPIYTPQFKNMSHHDEERRVKSPIKRDIKTEMDPYGYTLHANGENQQRADLTPYSAVSTQVVISLNTGSTAIADSECRFLHSIYQLGMMPRSPHRYQ
jgi:hypothetical protein